MKNETFRNMTISLKVAAEEKIILKRLAEKHGVSLSELLYNLVMYFRDQYEYIGRITPREEKLAENLRVEKRKNERLKVKLENADYRVRMEQDRALEAIKEKDELTYMLKEQKVRAEEQAEEIEYLRQQIEQLKGKNQELKRAKINNQATQITAGGLGVVAGFLLKRS